MHELNWECIYHLYLLHASKWFSPFFLFWKISKGKSHSEVSANFNGHLDFAQFLNQSKDTAYVILNRKD